MMCTVPPPPCSPSATAARLITPIISGLAWDLTGIPALAFIPIGLIVFLLVGFAPTIHVPSDME